MLMNNLRGVKQLEVKVLDNQSYGMWLWLVCGWCVLTPQPSLVLAGAPQLSRLRESFVTSGSLASARILATTRNQQPSSSTSRQLHHPL
jgi:hypothetical protein